MTKMKLHFRKVTGFADWTLAGGLGVHGRRRVKLLQFLSSLGTGHQYRTLDGDVRLEGPAMLVSSATCWCVLLLDLAGHLVPSGPRDRPSLCPENGGQRETSGRPAGSEA